MKLGIALNAFTTNLVSFLVTVVTNTLNRESGSPLKREDGTSYNRES